MENQGSFIALYRAAIDMLRKGEWTKTPRHPSPD
jgi:hypothetical protein